MGSHWCSGAGRSPFVRIVLALLVLFAATPPASAYSVLTHEQVVDRVWATDLQPLLLQRYPGLTVDQLHVAHAYAYGGAIVDDLGYYPKGNHLFSDLAHYVRSGDLIEAMLKESRDSNEFAFALGMLAHYSGDSFGHPAVNETVGIEFPKLRRRFGPVVTYEDNPSAHLRVEYSFDIVQIGKYRFPSTAYADFVGFQISTTLLARVYPQVYGLPLSQVLPNPDLAIGTFRYAVGTVLPKLSSAALKSYRAQFMKEDPKFNPREYLYKLQRKQFDKQWGTKYQRPGWLQRLLADIIVHLPKIGPLRALAFRAPTAQAESLYLQSVATTIGHYQEYIAAERADVLHLPNRNLDTGAAVHRGDYRLADETYFQLVRQLAASDFATASPILRNNILGFYSEPAGAPDPGLSPRERADLQGWLQLLAATAATPVPAR